MSGWFVIAFVLGVGVRRITKRQNRNDALKLTPRLALPTTTVG